MIRVKREEFLAILQSVEAGLTAKAIIEQSSCFVFVDDRVYTFNTEVACSNKLKLKGFKGVVQAKPLLQILSKMSEDEIEFSEDGKEIQIKGKRRKTGILMEQEIVLDYDKIDKPKKDNWVDLPEEFTEAIALLEGCASTDQNEFKITCFHIHPKWIEAMDNYQAGRFRMKTGVKQATLVRPSALKAVINLGVHQMNETESWLHFRNPSGLIYSVRRYVEEYDDIGHLFKRQGEPLTMPKGLAEGAERASIFSSENTDGNVVHIDLRKDKMRLRGAGNSGWHEEYPRIKYDGPNLSFTTNPALLSNLVTQHNECFVSEEYLQVDGGKFFYCARLDLPEGEQEQEEEGDDE